MIKRQQKIRRIQRDGIYDTLEEAKIATGLGWDNDVTILTRKELQSLLDGKVYAFDDGECTHFIMVEKPIDTENGK